MKILLACENITSISHPNLGKLSCQSRLELCEVAPTVDSGQRRGSPHPAVHVWVSLCHKRIKSSAQFPASCSQHISMHSLPSSASQECEQALAQDRGSWHTLLCHTPALQSTLSHPGCRVGWLHAELLTTQPTWHCSCQDGNKAKHALSHTHPDRLTTFFKIKFQIRI